MTTIRVRDWTKERIEEIRESESHSSHDSVIKSLLKDRKLAQFAGEEVEVADRSAQEDQSIEDKAFDGLTVLSELVDADNGVLFLWCPNCGNELAHLTVESPIGLSVFEMECQRCLNHLDQHAIVAIEIDYPIEQKLVDNHLQDDLKECVIDYWDRTLKQFTEWKTDDDIDTEHLVWQFSQYMSNFSWEWPHDVPAVGVESGKTYRNTVTDEYIDVLEPVTENRNALDSFEVKRYTQDTDPDSVTSEIMDSSTIIDWIVKRILVLVEEEPADGVVN
ncbi:MAG: hypothetical protein ABEH86_00390 [Haloarcula sp.]